MYLFQLMKADTQSRIYNIYIPLCIYFNFNCEFCRGSFSIFTFHYVSISTTVSEWYFIRCNDLHSTMYLFQPTGSSHLFVRIIFTFHYVSISTLQGRLHYSTSISHLHSTMYLFQRPKCPGDVVMVCKFTFHYVSISTLSVHILRRST